MFKNVCENAFSKYTDMLLIHTKMLLMLWRMCF